MADTGDDILGLVRRFLAAQPGAAPPPRVDRVDRVTVGRSRENWVFDAVWPTGPDGSGPGEVVEPLIVRRDPLGGLLETSRAEEFAVLRALEPTAVPVPQARWLDADGSQLGRPSLIMGREPGVCDYFVVNGARPLAERVELAGRFCDLLATLHTVDWAAAGLGAVLPDPGPEAARFELDRWEQILRRDQREPYPELELALDWLRATAPRSPRTVVVHGDFKPGNVLLEGERIVALLDWELAHLGDPMEDLGWITQPLRLREHLIPGAWERADLFARYTAATGIEVDEEAVGWWNVLASYKTAVMQVSGLRSFLEGRSDEPYRPTAAVFTALLDAAAPAARVPDQDGPGGPADAGHTVDEHLDGARRLLELVAAEPGLPAAAVARLTDARRLVRQVAWAWPRVLPFLTEDNRRLADLLAGLPVAPALAGDDAAGPGPTDVARAQARNLALRATLADAIGRLPREGTGPDARARIGAHLRWRLTHDPVHTRPPTAP